MKILVDRHHADLLYSLQRLFEDRLGFDLYIPIGHEWWDHGYWQFGAVFGDDRLAQQYLCIDAHWREAEPGIYLTFDNCHPERPVYGITLERARTWQWDCVLASVQENQVGFKRFASEMGARYLYHVGNARQGIDWTLNPCLLDATGVFLQGAGVQISQEFDHHTTFRFRDIIPQNRIVSFVNLLPQLPEEWAAFSQLRALLPAYEFRSYGHQCPDGFLTPVAAIAEEMSRAAWGFQDKPTGDGFGHIIHNWAAVGRPLIGHGRFYQGQRAEAFWRDGITCIDLDKHSLEAAAVLVEMMTPEGHGGMCRSIRRTFERIYDPVQDAGFLLKEFDYSEV